MASQYTHLLSPIRIGNRVFKNRMVSTPSGMHLNRASEPFPTDTLKAYYEGKARNGCAMMVVNGMSMGYDPNDTDYHNSDFDITSGKNRRGLADLVDGIHMYGCLAEVNFHLQFPQGYDVSGGVPNFWLAIHGMEWEGRVDLETAPREVLLQSAEEYTDMIATLKHDCGFDGCFLHMAYRMMPLGRFLSPITNKRTDEFGGSLENRFRYPRLVAELIRKKCGPDFIIEGSMSGCDPAGEGGLTTDDVAEYVKMAKGYFDLIQIKAPELDPAHPIQFHQRTPWLDLVAQVRQKSGGAVPIMCVGGFTHPDDGERALAEGKCDLVGMARSWIANPDFVRHMLEGTTEDLVPCVRCNKCHRTSDADPLIPGCTVNPTYGIEQKLSRIVKAPDRVKRVGIVGGGPAGLRAAIYLADRGHQVTLYEASDQLGGQLTVTRDVSFKWPLQNYRKWLIAQVEKRPVQVCKNTRATRELLEQENFDELLICVGAESAIPPIPGVEGSQVMTALEAYSRCRELGDRVAIIGGGDVGAETGIFLAQKGKEVTVIEQRRLIAADATPIHYYSMFRAEWEKLPNFHPITLARVTAIDRDGVRYLDREGTEQRVSCDSVVLACGMKPRSREAMDLCVPGVNCHLVGDCHQVGNVQRLNRVVFALTQSI